MSTLTNTSSDIDWKDPSIKFGLEFLQKNIHLVDWNIFSGLPPILNETRKIRKMVMNELLFKSQCDRTQIEAFLKNHLELLDWELLTPVDY